MPSQLYPFGTFKIDSGITLTMKAGVALYSSKGTLEVAGSLKAECTAESPVVFRSSSESSTWNGIVFKPSSGASVLDHVEVKKTGATSTGTAIKIEDSSPTITNSTIRESTGWAIYTSGQSAPAISDNFITGCRAVHFETTTGKTLGLDFHDNVVEKCWSSAAIYVGTGVSSITATSLGDNLVTNNSTTQGIYYAGGSGVEIPADIGTNIVFGNTGGSSTNQVAFSGVLTKSVTWETPMPSQLYPFGTFKIDSGITLTMKAGVALYSSKGTLEVAGTLKAEGTAESPVVFRSSSESSTWNGIVFKPSSVAS